MKTNSNTSSNKSTKNLNVILGIVLLVIIASVIYVKFSVRNNILYINETKASNYLMSQKLSSVTGLKAKLEEASSTIQKFDAIYIDRENILKFIETVEGKAKNNGLDLTINNVDIDKTHLSDAPIPYGMLNMTLTAAGNLGGINKFVADLENLPYFINFNTIRLAGSGGANNSWSINLAINGITN